MQWEYYRTTGDITKENLNRLGEDEWELVAVVPVTRDSPEWGYIYYFKRPFEDEDDEGNEDGDE